MTRTPWRSRPDASSAGASTLIRNGETRPSSLTASMRFVPEGATYASRSMRWCVGWRNLASHASGCPVARTRGWDTMISGSCLRLSMARDFTCCGLIPSPRRTQSRFCRRPEYRIPIASGGKRRTADWEPSFRTRCCLTSW